MGESLPPQKSAHIHSPNHGSEHSGEESSGALFAGKLPLAGLPPPIRSPCSPGSAISDGKHPGPSVQVSTGGSRLPFLSHNPSRGACDPCSSPRHAVSSSPAREEASSAGMFRMNRPVTRYSRVSFRLTYPRNHLRGLGKLGQVLDPPAPLPQTQNRSALYGNFGSPSDQPPGPCPRRPVALHRVNPGLSHTLPSLPTLLRHLSANVRAVITLQHIAPMSRAHHIPLWADPGARPMVRGCRCNLPRRLCPARPS